MAAEMVFLHVSLSLLIIIYVIAFHALIFTNRKEAARSTRYLNDQSRHEIFEGRRKLVLARARPHVSCKRLHLYNPAGLKYYNPLVDLDSRFTGSGQIQTWCMNHLEMK